MLKSMCKVAAAATFLACSPLNSSAQGSDPEFSRHGGFVVQYNTNSGRPLICYAAAQTTAPSGRHFDMSIAYDGKIWVITFPYAGAEAKLSGGLLVHGVESLGYRGGVISDAFDAENLGDGYYAFEVADGFIRSELSVGSHFVLDVPRIGQVNFSLSGSSAALKDVRTCKRNNGRRSASNSQSQTMQKQPQVQGLRAPSQPKEVQQPVNTNLGGAPNNYGGYDIVGTGQTHEKFYATVRGWTVLAASAGNKHAYCVGEYRQNGYHVRLGVDVGQWQLAVPLPSNPDWDGALAVDGQSRITGGSAVAGWTVAWLSRWDVDRLAQGNQAVLDINKVSYDFPLLGSAATITKIEECQQRQGSSSGASQTAERPQVPVSQGQTAGQHLKGSVGGNCPGGGSRLPLTRLCPQEAQALLRNVEQRELYVTSGCSVVINEAQLPGEGHAILYRALSCNGTTATLEFSGGARTASLTLIRSPMFGEVDSKLATIYTSHGSSMTDAIMQRAANYDSPPQFDARCHVQSGSPYGYPGDSFVVNALSATETNQLAQQGPGEGGGDCGSLGYFSDANSYWRGLNGELWHFDFGQDAMEIEGGSVTVIAKDGSGAWHIKK